MNNKFGLKLWSTNTDFYLRSAIELYKKRVFDYIELYVVPDTLEHIKEWKSLNIQHNIPFVLHAPHFMQKVNLAKADFFEYNKKVYDDVEKYRIALNASFTIVHSGIEGDIIETVRQLKLIRPQNILIENKPLNAPLGDHWICRGHSIDEIKFVLQEIDCGFCLDIGHAICTSNSLKRKPYEYLSEFNKLKPQCYHISDGLIDSDVDMHLHIGKGNFDFKQIFDIIGESKPIAVETKKDSKENLDDFQKDIKCLRDLQ